ncbi:MAG: TPM domain-containing protein [Chloroflexi bacterium]|nr:TPM domain-containing protein [Chloroflexota bacterium]
MKKNIAVFVLAAVLTLGFLAPSVVTAQAPCDQLVADEADVFKNRIGEVEAATKRLENLGADIRVRTIKTFGAAGNLDRYEYELEQHCPSWTAPDGTRKNNLIVLIISLEEQKTGLYYGSLWEGALGEHWTRIQTEIMNPRFRQGDFAGGFIAGLGEIQELLERQLKGQATSQAPAGQAPSGQSSWWIVLLAVVVIFGSLAGLLLLRSYRKATERRLAARQKARLAKQGAASRVNSVVEALPMLEIKVNAMADKVSKEDTAPLFEGLGKAKKLGDQGAQIYGELGHSAGDPESPRLGEAQLKVIEQEYQKVLSILREASETIGQVETQIVTLQQAVDGFSARTAEVDAAVDVALQKIEVAQKAGFKTTYPAAILAKARKSLEEALALSQKKQFLPAVQRAGEASNLASQAAQAADELPRKKQEAEGAISALTARIPQVEEAISKGRQVFERISSTYAEPSWDSIRGNGTEAENRVDWVLEAQDAARATASVEQQEWHKALQLTQEANAWLDEAESFMRSISALEVSLAAARRDAPIEIAAAQADIAKAWAYINSYDEDIRESLEDDLREAERKLRISNDELRKEKPDYLEVCKLAREANESADRVLAQARNEHEAAERLRARAAGALRDARTAVSRAKEYLEDHGRDVGAEARSYLTDAHAALQQAETATDLDTRISFAEKAEGAANSAYKLARSSVARSREWHPPPMPPIIISTHTGPRGGGGPSWGSRRSSPFGSGGGSTSWGSGRAGGFRVGGGRGGGSTGW